MTEGGPGSRSSRIRAIVRVSSGNFLEMYDFMVFGYYASAIGRAFFPGQSEFASLLSSFMAFGAGFLMRPLGAIVLGAYIDHHGRRRGLIVTLSLMSVGTLTIALVPGYAAVGLAAPVLVVLGRLLQGFSAGAELGGVSVYLSEIATPGKKGFYVAWQSGSQQVAVIFTAVMGVALSRLLRPEQMAAWGWRIPLLVGCTIVPLIFLLRRSLQETEAFLARRRRPTQAEILRSLFRSWPPVLLGVLLVTTTTVGFYTITAYTPTYGREVLRLSSTASLVVTLCVGISNLFWLPASGALSDRIGRRPILVACTVAGLLLAYPAMAWLVAHPSFERLLAVELGLSAVYGCYNGALVVYLTEIMPPEVKTAGFSLAYSLATAVFGGFTPAVNTWLIHVTGNQAIPGAWFAFASACGLVAVVTLSTSRWRLAGASPG